MNNRQNFKINVYNKLSERENLNLSSKNLLLKKIMQKYNDHNETKWRRAININNLLKDKNFPIELEKIKELNKKINEKFSNKNKILLESIRYKIINEYNGIENIDEYLDIYEKNIMNLLGNIIISNVIKEQNIKLWLKLQFFDKTFFINQLISSRYKISEYLKDINLNDKCIPENIIIGNGFIFWKICDINLYSKYIYYFII
jgi:hypothetical protein